MNAYSVGRFEVISQVGDDSLVRCFAGNEADEAMVEQSSPLAQDHWDQMQPELVQQT